MQFAASASSSSARHIEGPVTDERLLLPCSYVSGLFASAHDTHPGVRKAVCNGLVQMLQLQPERLAPHMDQIIEYMLESTQVSLMHCSCTPSNRLACPTGLLVHFMAKLDEGSICALCIGFLCSVKAFLAVHCARQGQLYSCEHVSRLSFLASTGSTSEC